MKKLHSRIWYKNQYTEEYTIDRHGDMYLWNEERKEHLKINHNNIDANRFSSFRDINSTNIYEGDILEHVEDRKTTSAKELYLVIFKNGCFMVECIWQNETYRHLYTMVEYLEIIGNKHENKILLNT